ncbi:MAG: hypothetical protein IJ737_05080 [Ruminococcus sp.]|nr:hypothetical protein [Ruminococcus sp.]
MRQGIKLLIFDLAVCYYGMFALFTLVTGAHNAISFPMMGVFMFIAVGLEFKVTIPTEREKALCTPFEFFVLAYVLPLALVIAGIAAELPHLHRVLILTGECIVMTMIYRGLTELKDRIF